MPGSNRTGRVGVILYRYINRQLLATSAVVTIVVMMVLVSGRFVKYLAQAAQGNIASDVLFLVMLYRIPEFLQLILPLSVFIAILLVLGRMYSDSEMAVLKAGGVGPGQVLRGLLTPIGITTLIVAACCLWITPYGETEVARILNEQRDRSVLELLTPGRFHSQRDSSGQRTAYAESLNREQGHLEGIFISDFRYAVGDNPSQLFTIRSGRGRLMEMEGLVYLDLERGVQYSGVPGDTSFQQIAYDRALVRVGEQNQTLRPVKVRSQPTAELLETEGTDALAELQWRFSLVFLVPLMLMAAVPLSHSGPRQGRFNRLIPALLGYLVYMGLLLVLRSRMGDENILPWWYSMVWVHVLALVIVVALFFEHELRVRWRSLRARA